MLPGIFFSRQAWDSELGSSTLVRSLLFANAPSHTAPVGLSPLHLYLPLPLLRIPLPRTLPRRFIRPATHMKRHFSSSAWRMNRMRARGLDLLHVAMFPFPPSAPLRCLCTSRSIFCAYQQPMLPRRFIRVWRSRIFPPCGERRGQSAAIERCGSLSTHTHTHAHNTHSPPALSLNALSFSPSRPTHRTSPSLTVQLPFSSSQSYLSRTFPLFAL